MGIQGGPPTVTKVDLGEGKRPVVLFYPKAYFLFQKWARMAGNKSYEFTCLGRCIRDTDGQLYVTDAYMVKHEGTSGTVDADDEDVIKLTMRLAAEGIDGCLVDTKGPVPPEEIRCWVHSHPGTGDGATFWSGTDDACINRTLMGDFLVSIVFDSEGNHPKCRIDLPAPRIQLTADIDLFIPCLTEEEEKAAEAIFKEKSSRKGYSSKGYRPQTGGRASHPSGNRARNEVISYEHYEHYDYEDDFFYAQGGGRNWADYDLPERGPSKGHSPSRSTIVTKGKPTGSEKTEKVEAKKEGASGFRERIKACFALNNSEVDPDWITWAQENPDKFGSWADGDIDSDEDEIEYSFELRDEDAVPLEDLTPEQLAELEAGIGSDLTEELIDDAVKESGGSDGDSVPDAETGERMSAIGLEEASKLIAMQVTAGDCSKDEAIQSLQKSCDVNEAAAKVAVEAHLGANP